MTTNFIVGGEGDLDNNRYLYSYEEYLIDDVVNAAGRLWMWGSNYPNNLADGTYDDKSSPIQTSSAGTNWKQISSGKVAYQSATVAIKTDGTLWQWGETPEGRLSVPTEIFSSGTNWKQVSSGGIHSGAVKTDGSLWSWGNNFAGGLGDNTSTTTSSPVQTISAGTNWKQVSCGYAFTAAVKTDGTLWTWGYNMRGQLGNNSTTSLSSPVQTVAGGTDWKQVSCGYEFVSAVKTDGTLWTWGFNYDGQLGNNDNGYSKSKSSPVQTVAGGTDWKYVDSGYTHAAGIKTDGTLWLWGNNKDGSAGKLGDNTGSSKSSPVQTVAGGTDWKQVSCGSTHTAAIKTDNSLWVWGNNNYGQLGTNSTTSVSSPVQTVDSRTNWRQVSAGGDYTGAVTY